MDCMSLYRWACVVSLGICHVLVRACVAEHVLRIAAHVWCIA